MSDRQKYNDIVNAFEQKGHGLTIIMIKICEEQYSSSNDPRFYKANTLAKNSMAVIESI